MTLVLPASFAFTMTSRGETTTTSAIFGSAATTCLTSSLKRSRWPRPVISVRVSGAACAKSSAGSSASHNLLMKNFLHMFIAAEYIYDGARRRWRFLLRFGDRLEFAEQVWIGRRH